MLILAMFGLCLTAKAETAAGLLKIEISRPICGSEPDMPECDIQAREAAAQGRTQRLDHRLRRLRLYAVSGNV